MDCKEFWKKYEESGLDPELERHLGECEKCREEFAIDGAVNRAVKELPDWNAPETLWERVKDAVPQQQAVDSQRSEPFHVRVRRFFDRLIPAGKSVPLRPALAAFAVLLIIAVAAAGRYAGVTSAGERARLQEVAIAEIEQKEKEYVAAIERLSQLVESRKETINTDMYLLYRQKLDVLDNVILLCSEAIEENQYNINARQYLVEAYREKTETLEKLAEISS